MSFRARTLHRDKSTMHPCCGLMTNTNVHNLEQNWQGTLRQSTAIKSASALLHSANKRPSNLQGSWILVLFSKSGRRAPSRWAQATSVQSKTSWNADLVWWRDGKTRQNGQATIRQRKATTTQLGKLNIIRDENMKRKLRQDELQQTQCQYPRVLYLVL